MKQMHVTSFWPCMQVVPSVLGGWRLPVQDLYMLFKVVGGRATTQNDVLKASTIWDEWIFAESQIRYAA